MKRYVEQLLEDLSWAKRCADKRLSSYFYSDESDDYFPIWDDVNDEGVKISELMGLEMFIFPKSNFLGDEEVSELLPAMMDLWQAYGMNPLFADCVTNRIKYDHLRISLNQAVYPVQGELVDLEMCDYLPGNCPFSSHCSCCVSNNSSSFGDKRA